MDNLEGKHKHEYSNDAYLSNLLWAMGLHRSNQSMKTKETLDGVRLTGNYYITRIEKSQRGVGKNKPQTATLIIMHVLRFAQLHSDWSLHNKPVRMKQNCSRKVRENASPAPIEKRKKTES